MDSKGVYTYSFTTDKQGNYHAIVKDAQGNIRDEYDNNPQRTLDYALYSLSLTARNKVAYNREQYQSVIDCFTFALKMNKQDEAFIYNAYRSFANIILGSWWAFNLDKDPQREPEDGTDWHYYMRGPINMTGLGEDTYRRRDVPYCTEGDAIYGLTSTTIYLMKNKPPIETVRALASFYMDYSLSFTSTFGVDAHFAQGNLWINNAPYLPHQEFFYSRTDEWTRAEYYHDNSVDCRRGKVPTFLTITAYLAICARDYGTNEFDEFLADYKTYMCACLRVTNIYDSFYGLYVLKGYASADKYIKKKDPDKNAFIAPKDAEEMSLEDAAESLAKLIVKKDSTDEYCVHSLIRTESIKRMAEIQYDSNDAYDFMCKRNEILRFLPLVQVAREDNFLSYRHNHYKYRNRILKYTFAGCAAALAAYAGFMIANPDILLSLQMTIFKIIGVIIVIAFLVSLEGSHTAGSSYSESRPQDKFWDGYNMSKIYYHNKYGR